MPKSKLTPEQIEEIKELKKQIEASGEKFVYSRVAKKYGVSGPTIRRNVEPNENDKMPQSYNPVTAKAYEEKFVRRYQLRLNTKSDVPIIEKLDSLSNKQGYIKNLILEDIKKDD